MNSWLVGGHKRLACLAIYLGLIVALSGAALCLVGVRPAVGAAGANLWVERYNGPGNSDDGATSVAVSPDGSTVFVTGGSTGTTSGYDYTTVAYRASNGAKLWVKRYNGTGNGYDQATAIGVSPDGSTV